MKLLVIRICRWVKNSFYLRVQVFVAPLQNSVSGCIIIVDRFSRSLKLNRNGASYSGSKLESDSELGVRRLAGPSFVARLLNPRLARRCPFTNFNSRLP